MKKFTETILQEILHAAGDIRFVTLRHLEVHLGKSGSELRPHLEDLKEEGLVVEHQEGFQLSRLGILYCRSRWA